MSSVFALVDCNNFYASCEKLFRPDLKHTPVVVLSNNDGCVVARSKEAKQLGIKMGVPVHLVQDDIKAHNIQMFSSNYALYADISARVMQTLSEMAVQTEVYSIDEAFCDLSGIDKSLPYVEFGQQMRTRIQQWIGLSVCVGISSTKTLAKLANHAAKKYPATGGVVDLLDPSRQQRLLKITPANEIWGVGKRIGERLKEMHIHTAWDLANANRHLIRERFSVVLAKTQQELNGESCIALEEITPNKQHIVCSRSFGERVIHLHDMREALANHIARGCEKLRAQQLCAKGLTIFFHTGKFSPQNPFYGPYTTGALAQPSCDTRDFLPLSQQLLARAWRDGYRYAKAGIMLFDIAPANAIQASLFMQESSNKNTNALMKALDSVNQQVNVPIFFASQGIDRHWQMRRDYLSPAYTTDWEDLRKVS